MRELYTQSDLGHISLFLASRSTSAAVVALVSMLAIFSHPAFAQQGTSTGAEEEITVVAPHLVQRRVVGRTAIGAPIEVISLPRRVSYADLDLTKQSDADELRKRITDTARAACKQLDSMYRDSNLYQSMPSDQKCVKTASSAAMDVAEQVIAAANQGAKK